MGLEAVKILSTEERKKAGLTNHHMDYFVFRAGGQYFPAVINTSTEHIVTGHIPLTENDLQTLKITPPH